MDDKGNNERRRPKFKKVDKHSGIPAYVQVMNQVKTEVILGRLVPGDQLPPVRELETMFDVNVNTILKALDKLKSEGVLSSEQGVGYFVTSNIAIESPIIDELGEFVRKIKNVGLDLYTTILLIEEVWKNE
ncbi:MAG TPA: GntR family transcriptional regulator [Fervidobacterium sp.]|nr:GntR family transcriptional regulator [Fervidobacterium sp.]HUM76567.1 GntR family transcriptional regulator [Fervidobacterium sp.]